MQPAGLWERLLAAGRLGRKRGAGFYRYADSAAPGEPGTVDEPLRELLAALPRRPAVPFTPERLMFLMVNEAALILQEGIASAADIDLAVVAGLGYPLCQGGILHYAD